MKTNLSPALRAMIIRMGPTLDSDEIAIRTGVDEEYVLAVLAEVKIAQRGRWCLVDRRTGRNWQVSSRRSAYLKAQVLGLIDWEWAHGAAPGVPLLAPPPGAGAMAAGAGVA